MAESALMIMVQISNAERQEIKRIAKSRGMTLGGLMGQLVRREIINDQASPDSPLMSESIQGTSPSSLDFGR